MKFVWLFGENLGNTMNNNSWCYFEHVLTNNEHTDSIDYYYIANKTRQNKKTHSMLPSRLKSRVVWRNSLKHHMLYWKSDMHFVTLSYKDVLPDLYKGKNVNKQPVVYLQHGTVAIKKIGYTKDTYDNALFKFIVYGTKEAQLLINENNFDSHQLKYSVAHPRYKRLVEMYETHTKESLKGRQILWFLTWREYLKNGAVSERDFFEKVAEVLRDKKLEDYLRKNDITLKLALHQFFDGNIVTEALGDSGGGVYEVVNAQEIDVMKDLVESELLITDYSSIGFDFTFLGKPVILYQFDSLVYSTNRGFYLDAEVDMKECRVSGSKELVAAIIGGNYKLNNFFASRLEDRVDLAAIKNGRHISELNSYFVDAQKNKVSIFGYNFFGKGGTVTATKALAEGLSKKGYLVELISLKRLNTGSVFPGGVIVRSFMNPWRSIKESVKYRLFTKQSLLSYLNSDIDRPRLIPYVGYALRRYLKTTKSRTVISTRETLHMFVDDAENPNIINKLYFFHTAADVVDKLFPGIMNQIAKRELDNALFVTDASRQRHISELGYKGYKRYAVTGNGVVDAEIAKISEIKAPGDKAEYIGVVLTRISGERSDDLKRIIEFGRYLKSKKIENIKVDVFGTGDYVFQFCDLITENKLEGIIRYKGLTKEPHIEIRARDFLVDFSEAHTFGMIYIEAILNGVMCFAKSNQGSKEVLSDIDGVIYSDWNDLVSKIVSLRSVKVEDLISNYKVIYKKYNAELVADKVVGLIN